MRINSAGNLGIGSIAPDERLHVAGNIKVEGNVNAEGGYIRAGSQPSFAAYKSANQTIPAGTPGANTRINWDSKIFDLTDSFDHNNETATNRGIFTAPYAGRYLFTGTIEFNNPSVDNSWITATLVLTGLDHRIMVTDPDQYAATGDIAESFAIIAQMDANDTAQIYVQTYGASGIELDMGNPVYGSSFQGYFLG